MRGANLSWVARLKCILPSETQIDEAVRELFELLRYQTLFKNLVSRDLKVRYRRSVLGFLWVLLNPLFMMIILYMVFSELFHFTTENYVAYLLSGIIFWNFYAQSTSASLSSFVGNSDLIRKIYLPKAIFPLSIVASAVINFAFSLIPLFVVFIVTGTYPDSRIVLLPLFLVQIVLFSSGMSLILSTLMVFFRDTQYIYEVLLLGWMYTTPIFYPESIIPHHFRFLLYLNPLYYFLSLFRALVYTNETNVLMNIVIVTCFSLLSFSFGWLFYNQYKDRLIFHL
ncbi:MAG: ABC transporter permease [Desulfoferrobacter sp.]